MINVRTIRKLKENDGLTLKKGKIIVHKTGYQVADYGKEAVTPEAVTKLIREMGGDCGIWYSEGVYYVDHSFRINTKKEALAIGRENHQISILKWSNMSLIYC